jgi:hypothetical protein
MKSRRFGGAVLALGVAICVLVLWTQSALGLDARAKACGADNWAMLSTFEVAHASEVRQHLPRMKPAPELEVSAPAYVVLFRDAIDLPQVRFNRAVVKSETGVICVFVNGVPEFYTDVDVTGWFK